jgi:hypothetical protein
MIAQQLTVAIPNQPGQLSKVSELLGDTGINVKAVTAHIMGEGAQIHMVVDDHAKAMEVLKAHKYDARERPVIAVEAPDHPGGLNAILRPLRDAGINVEYLYPAIGKLGDKAVIIVGADPIDDAVKALGRHYINVLDQQLFRL